MSDTFAQKVTQMAGFVMVMSKKKSDGKQMIGKIQ